MSVWILRIVKIIVGVLIGLIAVGWTGLLVQPKNFKVDDKKIQFEETNNLDTTVKEELKEYADKIFADEIVDIKTSVVWGKSKINVKKIWMPARFITYYIPGEGFFRYIEITWFGIPIINGYDLYSGDIAEFYVAGEKETGEKIEQGQNIALWAETIWSPSAYFTDNRLNWKKIDRHLLKLEIPFKESTDNIEISTDPETGLLNTMEAMRYKGQSGDKIRWQINLIEWNEFDGVLIPSESSVKWADEKKPWSYWSIKGVLYNIEISDGFNKEIQKYLNRD